MRGPHQKRLLGSPMESVLYSWVPVTKTSLQLGTVETPPAGDSSRGPGTSFGRGRGSPGGDSRVRPWLLHAPPVTQAGPPLPRPPAGRLPGSSCWASRQESGHEASGFPETVSANSPEPSVLLESHSSPHSFPFCHPACGCCEGSRPGGVH